MRNPTLFAAAFHCLCLACSAERFDSPAASGDANSAGSAGQASSGGASGAGGVADGSVADAHVVCPSLTLTGTIRDFTDAHPDFEGTRVGTDLAIVEPKLGADSKPVYAGKPNTATTTGKVEFDQWYRDTAGVNQAIVHSIDLGDMGNGQLGFSGIGFFPIDGRGFGNQGYVHNFHFTYEIHTRFVYRGGEVITLWGDDDIFLFVNGVLAINLGGLHAPVGRSVELDLRAAEFGIESGNDYPLDIFFAERHTDLSNLSIETNIGCSEP